MEKEKRDPKEKKCAICGKDMYAGEDWAYKRRKTGQRTKWFCSYKCMRAWDAKHDGKNAKMVTVDEVTAAPKEPVSRAVLARALAKEIKNGGSVIAYLTAEGYKNPYEAYNSVRHYCETKAPELAEVLKPLRDLPKGPQKKTGRPRKYQATVEKVDKVPPVEPDLQPVQCIAHVTAAEIQEAIEKQEPLAPMPLILQGGVNYQLQVDKVPEVGQTTETEIREAANVPLKLQGGVNYQLQVDETMKAEVQQKKPGFRYEIKTIETEIGDFSYDRKAHLLIFQRKDEEKEFGYQYLYMTAQEWDKLLIIVPQLADLMGVTL